MEAGHDLLLGLRRVEFKVDTSEAITIQCWHADSDDRTATTSTPLCIPTGIIHDSNNAATIARINRDRKTPPRSARRSFRFPPPVTAGSHDADGLEPLQTGLFATNTELAGGPHKEHDRHSHFAPRSIALGHLLVTAAGVRSTYKADRNLSTLFGAVTSAPRT
ncbi:unannotated protein [freshwater metagenome]|uniref:Unannotated protein n=1 Tax=freshwater metagenome TaxID=449393 RepID=A0A6J7JLI6_9ZZZZ